MSIPILATLNKPLAFQFQFPLNFQESSNLRKRESCENVMRNRAVKNLGQRLINVILQQSNVMPRDLWKAEPKQDFFQLNESFRSIGHRDVTLSSRFCSLFFIFRPPFLRCIAEVVPSDKVDKIKSKVLEFPGYQVQSCTDGLRVAFTPFPLLIGVCFYRQMRSAVEGRIRLEREGSL